MKITVKQVLVGTAIASAGYFLGYMKALDVCEKELYKAMANAFFKASKENSEEGA